MSRRERVSGRDRVGRSCHVLPYGGELVHRHRGFPCHVDRWSKPGTKPGYRRNRSRVRRCPQALRRNAGKAHILRWSARTRLPPMRRRLTLALALGGVLGFLTSDARAVDPFEIQVYDGALNAPGVAGIELHANTIASGPLRASSRRITRVISPSSRAGNNALVGNRRLPPIQSARRRQLPFRGGQASLEFIRPNASSDRLRLGVNFEVSRFPRRTPPNAGARRYAQSSGGPPRKERSPWHSTRSSISTWRGPTRRPRSSRR